MTTFKKTDEAKNILEIRHVLDAEVEEVIRHAEETGEKLYQPGTNRFLSKKSFSEATIYVEYSIIEEQVYEIRTAYAHRSKIVGE